METEKVSEMSSSLSLNSLNRTDNSQGQPLSISSIGLEESAQRIANLISQKMYGSICTIYLGALKYLEWLLSWV